MKSKIFLVGLSALAAVSLASCKSGKTLEGELDYTPNSDYEYDNLPRYTEPTTDGGSVDIYINYNGESGITFRGTSWNNTIDGLTYTQGSLLPTWNAIQKYTLTSIREASDYRSSNFDNIYTSIVTAGYKSEKDSQQTIDLFYNTVSNLKTAGSAGGLINLKDYFNKDTSKGITYDMPYLRQYILSHPAIEDMVTQSGKIYFAPFLDGEDTFQKTLIMDTSMVKKVLTEASKGDETRSGVGAAKNTLQTPKYQPFINHDDAEIVVSEDGASKKITINNSVTNIIKQQNDILSRDEGATGKELAEQLVDYIKAKYSYYGDEIWNLYIGENAAYNTDELIALMRVIKANPYLLTGDAKAEIEIFLPKGESSEAVDSVVELMQLWGVRGTESPKGNFYFANDGTLNALETTTASYEALDYLSALYDEGLILGNFYTSDSTVSTTRYLNQYFKKNTTRQSYGFMMYDEPSSVAAANDIYEGIGTDPDKRSDYAKGDVKGIYSVLPPRTYWTTKGNSSQEHITNLNGKELVRYYESNSTLQTTSWAVPKNSDNIEGALRIIDFMYSPFGQLIQNYGPEAYWQETKKCVTNMTLTGERNALISYQTKLEYVASKTDFWSFMRGYIGATHGIGHIRLGGLTLQATNYYGQVGTRNVYKAVSSGVIQRAMNGLIFDWYISAPSTYSTNVTDTNNEWDSLTGFWASNKLNKNEGWVNVITQPYGTDKSKIEIKTYKNAKKVTYEDMLKEQQAFNTRYLREYALTLGESCIPSYAAIG